MIQITPNTTNNLLNIFTIGPSLPNRNIASRKNWMPKSDISNASWLLIATKKKKPVADIHATAITF